MKTISVAEAAARWGISERSARNYCAEGRVPGAFLKGKTWCIPENAEKPSRRRTAGDEPGLLSVLREEMDAKRKGGIYHRLQVDLTYNSNHIEGSRLTQEQTRFIYETNTIGFGDGSARVDDIIETVNHFRCIDEVIASAKHKLSEAMICRLHAMLKAGTEDSRQAWFAVGAYKRRPNIVGGRETTAPEAVAPAMRELLREYNAEPQKTISEILDFHVRFERIHPFQDGNGRVGRLIMLHECLRCGIIPFVIEDDLKLFYYRGIAEWDRERGYLLDTALTAQDRFRRVMDYFRIDG